MFLKHLQLTNYRNYQSFDYKFKNKITILIGNNAQGKSNILEAIYFLATTKSQRADADEEIINYQTDFCRTTGTVLNSEESSDQVQLEIAMQKQPTGLAKKVKVNGLPRRVLDYIGNLSVVTFSPEDINLVSGPPSLRRWHLDLTLAQTDKEYKKALTQYGEVVTRKNKILKRIREGQGRSDEIDYWIDQQILFGNLVTAKRQAFFEYINNLSNQTSTRELTFEYRPNLISQERLLEYREREIYAATSLVGPHRDDFAFMLKNSLGQHRDLHHFGSRGEQRTAVLDLKIAELAFIEHFTGHRPLLLLDDVFSELDGIHRQQVIKLLPQQQTILAAVEVDPAISQVISDVSLLFVNNGQISESKESTKDQ